ncbi:MAG: hypothetical protein QHJ81_00445 [Anaerolineae bacterium]|nr:hypothetical protein [Anaerolineae bacterium]
MDLSTGRDIALVILIVEAFVLSLLPLALFYFGIRGMHTLRGKLDPLLPVAQKRLRSIAHGSQDISARIVRPFIAVSCLRAQAQGTIQALIRKGRNTQ